MSTVRIRNVGSFGREIRPDLDGATLAVVEVGEVVEVSARLAGRKPRGWVPLEPGEVPVDDGRVYRSAPADGDVPEHWEVDDHGEGLLAQVGVWDYEHEPWTDPVAEYSDGHVVYATPVVDDPGVPAAAAEPSVVIDVEPVTPTRATVPTEDLPTIPGTDTPKED